MLGIRCSQRHALPHITPIKCTDRELRSPPARAGSFCHPKQPFVAKRASADSGVESGGSAARKCFNHLVSADER
jgi:hypothetical protein